MEHKNVIGKLVKCIPVFMILILGFVMRCELFHSTATDTAFAYYPMIQCKVSENEFVPFMSSLKENAENLKGSYFFVVPESDSRIEHKIRIYTNDNRGKTTLEVECGLVEGVANSLISGSTKVTFLSLEDLSYDEFIARPYFGIIGTPEEENAIYEALKGTYDVSYPQIMQAHNADMIVIVWGMVAIFIILINGGIILRRKKEMLIRTIYGEDVVKITIRSMISDLIIYELLYFLAKFFVSRFISGDYKPELAFLIYQVGVSVAVSLNLIYLRSNFRAVLSNVTDNKGTLVLLYVLKVFAFLIAVFTVTNNLSSLQRAVLSNETDEMYSLYKEDMFITIIDNLRGTVDPEERANVENNIWNALYSDPQDMIYPIISMKLADGNRPIIFMNEYALPLLPESLGVTKGSGEEVVVLYPEDSPLFDEEIEGLLGLCLEQSTETQWKSQAYAEHIKVPYIESNQLTGFSEASNPIIIYGGKDVQLRLDGFANNMDVIYHIEEEALSKLDETFGISKQGFQIVSTNMGELYEYQMSLAMRIVRFLSSLCVLVVVLNLAICIILCKMEYRIFGMNYALKKVLGYSLIVRNKSQFLRVNVMNLIFLIALAVVGAVTRIYDPALCIFAGCVFIIVENFVMVSCILRIEGQSMKKILKGGCL